jgi:hypothetical protein
MDDSIAARQNCKSVSSLVGGFTLMMVTLSLTILSQVFGSMYITGNIGPYVRIYFNKLNGTDTACSDSEVFLLLPGITITITLMLPISGFISLRINHRLYFNFLIINIGWWQSALSLGS